MRIKRQGRQGDDWFARAKPKRCKGDGAGHGGRKVQRANERETAREEVAPKLPGNTHEHTGRGLSSTTLPPPELAGLSIINWRLLQIELLFNSEVQFNRWPNIKYRIATPNNRHTRTPTINKYDYRLSGQCAGRSNSTLHCVRRTALESGGKVGGPPLHASEMPAVSECINKGGGVE